MPRQQQAWSAARRSEDTVLKRGPRAPMPLSRRAKQFTSFDAFSCLKEAIAATERKPELRRELTDYAKDQINHALVQFQKGQQVAVVYGFKRPLVRNPVTGTKKPHFAAVLELVDWQA